MLLILIEAFLLGFLGFVLVHLSGELRTNRESMRARDRQHLRDLEARDRDVQALRQANLTWYRRYRQADDALQSCREQVRGLVPDAGNAKADAVMGVPRRTIRDQ